MTQITIPAQVVNGHLHHDISLAQFEGQAVLATVTLKFSNAAQGNAANTPLPKEIAETEPDAPPWLDVENDVYFPMKPPAKPLGKVKVNRKRGKPCIILPEELPDE